MFYKNSLKSSASGTVYELAQYEGEFRQGRREGKGTMVWGDGTTFEGTWKNDMRHQGKLIMSNNCVYIGRFDKDLINGPSEMLLSPNMPIYQGEFVKC